MAETDVPSRPQPPFAQAKVAAGLCFLSGLVGTVDGRLPADFDTQVTAALANLEEVLTNQNLTLHSLLDVTVFLTDMAHYDRFNLNYRSFFDDRGAAYPTRTCIGVAELPLGAAVELKAIASAAGNLTEAPG